MEVLYLARSPVYDYGQGKTFPDAGELVTYTAYVANRCGVDTKEFASEVTTYWEMLSPCGGGLVRVDQEL